MANVRTEDAQLLHCSVVRIQRVDEARRIVFGMVYEGMVLDTYGEFMFGQDVETMCHRFAQLAPAETIDTNHDNIPNGSYPVESFIAREGDRDFPEGSWVLGIKVPDDHVWRQIVKGELNGFSFEALVKPVDVVATVKNVRDRVGVTEAQKEDGGHTHVFFVQTDDRGRVIRGWTDEVDGHSHIIRRGTSCESGGEDGHKHRFFT